MESIATTLGVLTKATWFAWFFALLLLALKLTDSKVCITIHQIFHSTYFFKRVVHGNLHSSVAVTLTFPLKMEG
jgi:hypothetical protein